MCVSDLSSTGGEDVTRVHVVTLSFDLYPTRSWRWRGTNVWRRWHSPPAHGHPPAPSPRPAHHLNSRILSGRRRKWRRISKRYVSPVVHSTTGRLCLYWFLSPLSHFTADIMSPMKHLPTASSGSHLEYWQWCCVVGEQHGGKNYHTKPWCKIFSPRPNKVSLTTLLLLLDCY